MAFFNYPFHIAKDKPAVAAEVQTNFDSLLAWVLENCVQKDGTTSMEGPLVTPPGPPTAPEHAADKAYVDAVVPIGVVWEYGGTSLPAGWLWADGATYSNTAQPKLFAAIGRSFTDPAVPAGSFQVQDRRKRVGIGADATDAAFALGKTGGQRNTEVPNHVHPIAAHAHTITGAIGTMDRSIDHLHTAGGYTTDTRADHDHGIPHGSNLVRKNNASPLGANLRAPGDQFWVGLEDIFHSTQGNHAHGMLSTSGASDRDLNHLHNHSLGIANNTAALVTDNNTGGSATAVDKNLPPYLAINYIVYAGFN